jgi:hypothetical protein
LHLLAWLALALTPAHCRKDILDEVLKGLVILAILERLQITRHSDWVRDMVAPSLARFLAHASRTLRAARATNRLHELTGKKVQAV